MLHYSLRFLLLLLLSFIGFGVAAQRLSSIQSEEGFALDYPSSWNMEISENSDSIFLFDDGAVYGFISMVEARFVRAEPLEVLEEVLSQRERADRNNGDLSPFEEYTLDGDWEAVRTNRIRSDDRLYEVFIMAEVREISVYLRATFRRGSEDEYLPVLDALVASSRLEETDTATNPEISLDRPNFDIEFIGSGDNLLNIGALTASYPIESLEYQFDYPETWEITRNDDETLRFLNREGATLFGTIQILADDDINAISALETFLSTEDDYGEISPFNLNGLSAARSYRDNTRGGTMDIAMAADFGEFVAILQASSNASDFAELEPILRAVLYSLRPIGSPLELSLLGIPAREALNSAFVYGLASPLTNNSAIPLESTFVTDNGLYTFNYPDTWLQAFEEGFIILATNPDYELYEVEAGESQIFVSFLDRIASLEIDEFSPTSIMNYIIENDEEPELWTNISEFMSLGRRGAYADYLPRFATVEWRTILVELDAQDLVYVRLDIFTAEDELGDFMPTALAILETADFAD